MAPKRRPRGFGLPGGGSFLVAAMMAPEPAPPAPPPAPSPPPPEPQGTKRKLQSKMALALAVADDPTRAAQALADLKRDKYSRTGESSRANWWRTWQRFHEALYPGIPVLPLTPESIEGVCSLFKAAGYISTSNYAMRAKAEHMSCVAAHGVSWPPELERSLTDSIRSATRGLGAARQSAPLDMLGIPDLELGDDPITVSGPCCPAQFAIAGSFFLTREIEISSADFSHISINDRCVVRYGKHLRTWLCLVSCRCCR